MFYLIVIFCADYSLPDKATIIISKYKHGNSGIVPVGCKEIE